MKMRRVFCAALAALMTVLTFASCTATAPTINVTLKISPNVDPDFPTILEVNVPLKSTDPTVLEAFIEGCMVNSIDYTLTDDEKSVVDIDQYPDYVDTETGTNYYWIYTVNGVEPGAGRAADASVADGDVIEYIYVAYVPDEIAQ